MSDSRFPSCLWTGFYTYRSLGGKHGMDLHLTFSSGRMTGDGADELGLFIIDGNYDCGRGECHWTKTYVGAHEVRYRGFAEDRGIWGTWEIPGASQGGFQIWPLGNAEAEEMEMEESETPAEPWPMPR